MPSYGVPKLRIRAYTDTSVDAMKRAGFLAFKLLVDTRSPLPNQTDGAHAFTCLIEFRPDLSTELRGNITADPFLNDANLPAFWRAVELLW